MSKRLFVAVDVDEATRAQAALVSAALRERIGPGTRASWVRPGQMHVTLLFFSAADPGYEDRIRRALAQPIAEPVFAVSFQGLRAFPERGSPRVVWLDVREGAGPLRRVHERLAERLHIEPGAFTPHLTVARLKGRLPADRAAEIAEIPASAGPSAIDRVTLYESCLSPAGPRHLRLADALLQP